MFAQPPYGAWAIVSGPGAPEFVAHVGMGTEVHRMGDEWRLSAPDHATLLDELARIERPAARLRIEVDPIDR